MGSEMVVLAVGMVAAFLIGLLSDRIKTAKVTRREKSAPDTKQDDVAAKLEEEFKNVFNYTEDIATKGGNDDGR